MTVYMHLHNVLNRWKKLLVLPVKYIVCGVDDLVEIVETFKSDKPLG